MCVNEEAIPSGILDGDWEAAEIIEYAGEVFAESEGPLQQDKRETEEIVVEAEVDAPVAGKADFLSFLKRNKYFIAAVFFIWIITGSQDYLLPLFNTPVIGRPLAQLAVLLGSGVIGGFLRYVTATYNGPVWELTPYTFLVAIAAKSAYLLAMTEVVFPSLKELLSDKQNAIGKYAKAVSKARENVEGSIGNRMKLGLLLMGGGAAMMLSNFLSRNGKIDKSFILILISFVMIKGLSGALPSVLDSIARKAMQFAVLLVSGASKQGAELYGVMRTGAACGFLLAVVVGNFGESAGYILGLAAALAGGVLSFASRGTLKYDD